ncbi:MAG: hypothetical protein D6687_06465 [Acidobacteria bacterium]|jgi:C-terminal processing protease CtpA/Prc|nr:MAG: hypothetical protein D6687_06465 [Acidobacteriota bacterium]GIU82564.1 MAG: hypothetical protein KatS3mg006_1628 [Pyrinomonadaceae bacterium]
MKETGSENLEREISQLISRLEKVKAPSDFTFKLKAKIAAEKQKRDRRKVLLIRLSYALPALIAVLSVALFTYFLKERNEDLASFRENQITKESPSLERDYKVENVTTLNREESSQKVQNQTKEKVKREGASVAELSTGDKDSSKSASVVRANERKEKIAQFSRTEALSVPETAEFSSGKSLETPALERGDAKISFSEILKQIGIEGSFEEQGGFRVRFLKSNSVAERAGFKTEDLIVAIDEKVIGKQDMYFEKLEIKKFKVKRGAKELSITLKP